jgi:hypothetical protein
MQTTAISELAGKSVLSVCWRGSGGVNILSGTDMNSEGYFVCKINSNGSILFIAPQVTIEEQFLNNDIYGSILDNTYTFIITYM